MNRQLATNLFFAGLLLAVMYGIIYTFFIKASNESLSGEAKVSEGLNASSSPKSRVIEKPRSVKAQ
jgi:phosphotransferase system  glucose/maltose/N-acetylglucosamine-specific IIC component